MANGESGLLQLFDNLIAEDLGIKPEQVTIEFIHEMRKLMYTDPTYPLLLEQQRREERGEIVEHIKINFLESLWRKKCQVWAQQVLQRGPTSCS